MAKTLSHVALQAFNVGVPIVALPLVLRVVGFDGFSITGTIALCAYIINTIVDFGFSRFSLGRIAAKDPDEQIRYVNSFLSLQLVLGGIAAIVALTIFSLARTTGAGILLVATFLACLQVFVSPSIQVLCNITSRTWLATVAGRLGSLVALCSSLMIEWPQREAPWIAAVFWLLLPIAPLAYCNYRTLARGKNIFDLYGAYVTLKRDWFSAGVHCGYSVYAASPAIYSYFFATPSATGAYLFADRIRNIIQSLIYPFLLGIIRTGAVQTFGADTKYPMATSKVWYACFAGGLATTIVVYVVFVLKESPSTVLAPSLLSMCMGVLALASLFNYFGWNRIGNSKEHVHNIGHSAAIIGVGLGAITVASMTHGLQGVLLLTICIELSLCARQYSRITK